MSRGSRIRQAGAAIRNGAGTRCSNLSENRLTVDGHDGDVQYVANRSGPGREGLLLCDFVDVNKYISHLVQ